MIEWFARCVITMLLLVLALEYCYPHRLHHMWVACGLVLVLSAGIWIHWFAGG